MTRDLAAAAGERWGLGVLVEPALDDAHLEGPPIGDGRIPGRRSRRLRMPKNTLNDTRVRGFLSA